MNTGVISNRLLAILYAVKNTDYEDPFLLVKDELKDIYHPKMSVTDIMHHVINCYFEARSNPNFQMSFRNDDVEMFKDIVSSTIKYSTPTLFFPDLKEKISLETMLESIAKKMLSDLRLTNIGWSDQYKEYVENRKKRIENEK